jgi:hypothetical protein
MEFVLNIKSGQEEYMFEGIADVDEENNSVSVDRLMMTKYDSKGGISVENKDVLKEFEKNLAWWDKDENGVCIGEAIENGILDQYYENEFDAKHGRDLN